MKYAKEILGLMPAYPHRQWKMAELVREVLKGKPATQVERDRARQGVLRVLRALEADGQITRHPLGHNVALYQWGKVRHEVLIQASNVRQELRQ